jgi:predicted signal transduction protein with EAL and GGDEF domain
MVARLGGDEFTVLVTGTYDAEEVVHIGDRIQQKLKLPFLLRGHEIYSSASIGILHASSKHETPEDVMRDADTAMYHAKRAGKARYEIFDDTMHNEAKENLLLETELRHAMERGEIGVFYQPIFELETGRVVCVESLARWEHPELGSIGPDRFIPLAEEIGLIDRLCDQILSRACIDIASLDDYAVQDFQLSLNLSCRQFTNRSLVRKILDTLKQTGFPPSRLKLEITESVFFEHQDHAVDMLNELRAEGVQIDIDDFGTGYSNLGYLQKLPVSSLKIDRSFIATIAEDGDGEIVKAIITLARNLGLTVVAEGIETQYQLEFLRNLSCDAGQGFLLGPPVSIDGLTASLVEYRPFDAEASDLRVVSAIEALQ